MKFIKNLTLILGIVVCFSGIPGFANNNYSKISHVAFNKITVDKEKLQLEHEPFFINGTRMLPLRSICEELGYEVYWNEKTRQAKIIRANDKVILTIDDTSILINNESKKIRLAPKIVDGRTYVIPAVIQAGLLEDITTNSKGNFIITSRHKTIIDDISTMRKTIYNENPDGLITGVAEVCVPIIDNPNNKEGLSIINNYYKSYSDSFSDDELRNELREVENYEFIDTLYIDCNVVANMKNVISIEHPTFLAGSYSDKLSAGKMFYKSTGKEVKVNEMFKNTDDIIYDMLMNAYKNSDERLLSEIELLRYAMINMEGIPDVSNEEIIRKIADLMGNQIAINDEILVWISIENENTFLNFRYYGYAGYRYLSVNLKDNLMYLNKTFMENI